MDGRERRTGGWGRMAVVALLAACSPVAHEEPQALVARATVAVHDGRFDEALGLLREVEQRPDAPAAVVSVAQDQRLIALAGLHRGDELRAACRELGDQRGGLALVLAARAGVAWLQAGGGADELEALCAQADRVNPYDGQRLRQAFAARAARGADAAAVCLFCGQPGCEMDCVQDMGCVLCPPRPKP